MRCSEFEIWPNNENYKTTRTSFNNNPPAFITNYKPSTRYPNDRFYSQFKNKRHSYYINRICVLNSNNKLRKALNHISQNSFKDIIDPLQSFFIGPSQKLSSSKIQILTPIVQGNKNPINLFDQKLTRNKHSLPKINSVILSGNNKAAKDYALGNYNNFIKSETKELILSQNKKKFKHLGILFEKAFETEHLNVCSKRITPSHNHTNTNTSKNLITETQQNIDKNNEIASPKIESKYSISKMRNSTGNFMMPSISKCIEETQDLLFVDTASKNIDKISVNPQLKNKGIILNKNNETENKKESREIIMPEISNSNRQSIAIQVEDQHIEIKNTMKFPKKKPGNRITLFSVLNNKK